MVNNNAYMEWKAASTPTLLPGQLSFDSSCDLSFFLV